MIFTIFDFKVKGIEPLVWQFNYCKGQKLTFDEKLYEKLYPLSNSTIQHVYVGF